MPLLPLKHALLQQRRRRRRLKRAPQALSRQPSLLQQGLVWVVPAALLLREQVVAVAAGELSLTCWLHVKRQQTPLLRRLSCVKCRRSCWPVCGSPVAVLPRRSRRRTRCGHG